MSEHTTPQPAEDLAAAIAAVMADFRAEDPARAHLNSTEIIDETLAELDPDDITTLVDTGDMSDEVAQAYRTVLDTPLDQLHTVLNGDTTALTARDGAATGEDTGEGTSHGGPLPVECTDLTSQTAAGARSDSREVVGLVCPECGEDAVEQAPTALTPYEALGEETPGYCHPDGEPLCPVMGSHGYPPADPVEVLADESADEIPDESGGDPLRQACAAVAAADHAAEASAGCTDSSVGSDDGGEAVSEQGWER
ncbi:hypothetical protein [Pseudonocardia humida]|uniref:Uncharacterized protein n=1 Tax=Pseudonocardia humida TaxID=2800819 RepID=A0ABT1A553_9PSEU|nr:hypothetical protein [Pseudonocardia humida]MCO1658118.1 hypothetical protein [Pseudonocardia humida]